MSKMPPIPMHVGPKHARFRDKPHAKLLMGVIVFEAVTIVALLVWFVATKPAVAPTQQTAQSTPDASATTPPKLAFKQIATGLEAITAITALRDTSDQRLFIAEQAGTIRIVSADGSIDPAPFLDITGRVQSGGEMGLLGFTFHPRAVSNRYFFVNYIDKAQNTIVARFSFNKDTGLADPASEKQLLKIPQPYPNHKGGDLAFGPDGYLYIALGDGGSHGDPDNRSQNMGELLGKILRIDVDRGDPYVVPPTNPFVNTSDAKPEIWAVGLRNPWRMGFDRQTGDLYIGDVGQAKYEEINFQPAGSKGGHNYGWRCYEGKNLFNPNGCQDASTYIMPVAVHDHTENRCSITSGYVYRGSTYSGMAGKYFYADYCSGQIFYIADASKATAPLMAADTDYTVSTFGQDSRGELYLSDRDRGILYQVQDANQKP